MTYRRLGLNRALFVIMAILACFHGFARAETQTSSLEKSEAAIGRTVGNYRLTGLDGRYEKFYDSPRKPALVSFFYSDCSEGCPLVINNIASMLGKLPKNILDDFSVVSISIDPENDTPEKLATYSKPFREEFRNWRFVVADEETLKMLALDLGFAYEKKAGRIEHLNRVTLLNSLGVVTRHFYGSDINNEDFMGELKRVAEGGAPKSGISSLFDRALAFCTTYDPLEKRYKPDFKFLAVWGIQALLALGTVVFLILSLCRRRIGDGGHE